MTGADGVGQVTQLRPLGRTLPAAVLGDWRRALASRHTHAVAALAHLSLCVAVAAAVSDVAGVATTFGLCATAAAVALIMLFRAEGSERTATRGSTVSDTPAQAPNRPTAGRARAMERQVAGLLAFMSHELRTPLNAIIGFAEMIEHAAHHNGPRARELAGHIRASGAAMVAVSEETLALTGAVAAARLGEPVAVEVRALAARAIATCEPAARARRIAIVIREEIDGLAARTEPTATAAALAAMLKASIGCAAEGSALAIEARRTTGHVELIVTLDEVRSDLADATGTEGAELSAAALQLGVAQALLAIQGIHLHTATGLDGRWRAMIELPTH